MARAAHFWVRRKGEEQRRTLRWGGARRGENDDDEEEMVDRVAGDDWKKKCFFLFESDEKTCRPFFLLPSSLRFSLRCCCPFRPLLFFATWPRQSSGRWER